MLEPSHTITATLYAYKHIKINYSSHFQLVTTHGTLTAKCDMSREISVMVIRFNLMHQRVGVMRQTILHFATQPVPVNE